MGAVVVVAEEFQCGWGEAFGFVDDEQCDQFGDATDGDDVIEEASSTLIIGIS